MEAREIKFRYVWLNLNTGEFSNSWGDSDQKLLNEADIKGAADGWKLIKYECLTDDNFEFYNRMKITTNQL